VAIIMDGNGRWAELRGQPRLLGHAEGAKSVRAVVTAARELGLEALTLYAFSVQNWSRPEDEVLGLMQLLYDYLEEELPTMLKNGVRLRSIGDVERLPGFVRERLEKTEDATKAGSGMVLTLALSYGGREEIVRAAREIAEDVSRGQLAPDQVTEEEFERRTFTRDLPPLDLIIRTSGEMRLSNFLLWQAAYAELVVVETPWPEFRKEELVDCLELYGRRERRYGLTSEQLAARGELSSP
jgi:undecaprenyl diphosphate synthase